MGRIKKCLFSVESAAVVFSAALFLLVADGFAQQFVLPQTNRVKIVIDTSWKFYKGDLTGAQAPGFSEASMTTVHLPHNFENGTYAMATPYYRGIGWYRKHFKLSSVWQSHRITLYFEGAMTVAQVWINGNQLTTHMGGFNPFSYDISQYCAFDGSDNIIAVRLDNSYQRQVPPEKPDGSEIDFYMFGGIYRDVYLILTDSLFIPDPVHDWINRFPSQANQGGQYITFPAVSAASATVKVDSWVKNTTTSAKSCRLVYSLVDTANNIVQTAEVSGNAAANAVARFTQSMTVANPLLWFPWKPVLYTLYTTVYSGTTPVDYYKTKIGIKKMRWTQSNGVYCNDQWFKILGLNRSQGWPFVGYAVPNLQQRRDAEILKEESVNFVRMAHYLQDDEFLAACDSLGILTWLEIPGWHCCNNWTADTVWMNRHYDALCSNVRTARNHACVAIWGAGINEGPVQTVFETSLNARCKSEDSTRPTSMARWTVASQPFDLFGNNWFTAPLPATNPMVGTMGYLNTEHTGHTFPTWRTDNEQRLIDVSTRHEQMTSEGRARAWCHGSSGWCAFDYNTNATDVPGVLIRPHGAMDLYHIPKFTYYFYKSQSAGDNYDGSRHPMVFIQNFNMANSPLDRKIVTNCEQVELFVNGVSQGIRSPDPDNTSTRWCTANANVPCWWMVDLGAAYSISGTQVMWEQSGRVYRYRIETSSDNATWSTAVDKTANTSTLQTQSDAFSAGSVRYVRITVTGLEAGVWASFYNFRVMSSGANIALGKTASASSEEAGNTASNGNDGGANLLAHPPIIFSAIPFQAGELKAEGRIGGVVVATHIVRTPGAPQRIVLTADPVLMQANGADFSRVIATVVDINGTAVPYDSTLITFSANALGTLIGDNPIRAKSGAVGILAKGAFTTGTLTVTATAGGLATGTVDITLRVMNPEVGTMPVPPPPAFYRGTAPQVRHAFGTMLSVPGKGRRQVSVFDLKGSMIYRGEISGRRLNLGKAGDKLYLVQVRELKTAPAK